MDIRITNTTTGEVYEVDIAKATWRKLAKIIADGDSLTKTGKTPEEIAAFDTSLPTPP